MRAQDDAGGGWRATLDLSFAHRQGRTFIAGRRHSGPLMVQRPFYPEGHVCHTYVVHPPGGVVGGDELELSIHAGPGAHALLTTPAATKFYRSGGPTARQTQRFLVDGATLEWLPQESIYYPGVALHSSTRLSLVRNSRIIAWDIGCLGLPARAALFDNGTLRLGLELWEDGRPLLVERLRIDGGSQALTAPWGWAGYAAFGTLLAYRAEKAVLEETRSIMVQSGEIAATIIDGVLVIRCLARHTEHVKAAFLSLWQVLRPPILGRSASPPRIWST